MLLFLPTLFLFDVNQRLNCRRSLSFDVTLPPPSHQCYLNVTLMLPQCYSFFPRYFSLLSTSALIVVVLFLFDVTLPPPSRSMLDLPQCYLLYPISCPPPSLGRLKEDHEYK